MLKNAMLILFTRRFLNVSTEVRFHVLNICILISLKTSYQLERETKDDRIRKLELKIGLLVSSQVRIN